MPITGIHHITLCAGGAQEDVDFITKVLGKRLIKQTVLFDGRYAHYHLLLRQRERRDWLGADDVSLPSVPGRVGSGQISATTFSAPQGSASFWVDHLNRHQVEHSWDSGAVRPALHRASGIRPACSSK